jgi:hypothetical protein
MVHRFLILTDDQNGVAPTHETEKRNEKGGILIDSGGSSIIFVIMRLNKSQMRPSPSRNQACITGRG